MKTYKLIILITALLTGWSCKNDPWADIANGDWNHERTILEIKFQGQAGKAVITSVDGITGTIDLNLAVDMIEDLSRVKLEELMISYKANSSVSAGETIDFTGASPSISITSQTGDTRNYTINMSPFTEDLIGVYDIRRLFVYGGTGPEYGGGAILNPGDKSWVWDQSGEGPNAETDNYLEFTLTEILENGNTSGICVNHAGKDGKYWNAIFNAEFNKEGDDDINLSKFYRQVPKGESIWIRDYSTQTIIFTDSDGRVTSGQLLNNGTYPLLGNDISLTVPNQAFRFILNGTDDWDNIFTDYDKFVKKPRNFFILIEKR
jgi:hypothetical protein